MYHELDKNAESTQLQGPFHKMPERQSQSSKEHGNHSI